MTALKTTLLSAVAVVALGVTAGSASAATEDKAIPPEYTGSGTAKALGSVVGRRY